jgi:hypothetical protein
VNIRRNLVLLARFYNRRGASSQAKETLRNLTNPQRNGIVLLPELMGEFTGEAGTK